MMEDYNIRIEDENDTAEIIDHFWWWISKA